MRANGGAASAEKSRSDDLELFGSCGSGGGIAFCQRLGAESGSVGALRKVNSMEK